MKSRKDRDRRRHTTARRAIEILRTLGEAGRPLGTSAIADRTGLPKATVHRLLKELEQADCLIFEEVGQVYRLGPALIQLGEQARAQWQLVNIARPTLEQLAAETGETVNLGVLHDDVVLVLDTVRDPGGPRLTVNLGPTAELHCSAMGKALLSALPPRRRDELLARITFTRRTVHTLQDPSALRHELELAAKEGLAYDREESELGLFCVGAPIRDAQGFPVAAVSVSGPVTRLEGERLRHLHGSLQRAVERLSALLAYNRPNS